jgi:3-hydroxybutyryl-CoA dehydrogenase
MNGPAVQHSTEIRRIRVIGAGVMGSGIAQLAGAAGIQVELADLNPTTLQAATGRITAMYGKLVVKGKMTAAAAAAASANITTIDNPLAPTDVDLIIEAVREDLDIKRTLFHELEQACQATTLFATNTSSLQVTAIAAALDDPTRLAGLHFFNPVPLMRVVEIIPGLRTTDSIVPVLTRFVRTLGHEPVITMDTPGFIINHAGRGLITEALHILDDGTATAVDVDNICRDVLGLRMGAFELLDLTGLDVSHPVLESIWAGFYDEPRLRPSATTRMRAQAGLLGRKSGAGFYRYPNGIQQQEIEPAHPAYDGSPIWTDNTSLSQLLSDAGVKTDAGDDPDESSVVLLTPFGESTVDAALRQNLPLPRTLGVDPFTGFAERFTLAVHPGVTPAAGATALAALAATGLPVTVVRDSPASVAQRLLASIVNTASGIAQQRIATAADIDTAVRLGLGYPLGPLQWGETVGGDRILTILRTMHRDTGDQRYRPGRWLIERVQTNLSLTEQGTDPAALLDDSRIQSDPPHRNQPKGHTHA